jgi:hypothetical protein
MLHIIDVFWRVGLDRPPHHLAEASSSRHVEPDIAKALKKVARIVAGLDAIDCVEDPKSVLEFARGNGSPI